MTGQHTNTKEARNLYSLTAQRHWLFLFYSLLLLYVCVLRLLKSLSMPAAPTDSKPSLFSNRSNTSGPSLFVLHTHTHTHTISYLQFANPLTSHFPFTPFFFFFHLFLSCPYKRAAQETRLSIRWWCNVTIVLYLVAYRSTLYPTSGRLLIANQPIHILQDALQTHNVEYIGSLISM